MINFLKIMITFLICWIIFTIYTRCYASAIIAFICLIYDILKLHEEIAFNKMLEDIDLEEKGLIDEYLRIIKGNKRCNGKN